MRKVLFGLMLGLCAVVAQPAQAAIVQFDLVGKAGPGLLPGNEVGTVNGGGSGGEIGAGISFDNVSKILTINIGWGSGNGFSDMSGVVTGLHIHDPGVVPDPLNANGSVIIPLQGLAGFTNSATTGGFQGAPAALTDDQATALMSGRLYINAHTTLNGGGEIRGNLTAVPEPSSAAVLGLLVGIPAFCRRRRR